MFLRFSCLLNFIAMHQHNVKQEAQLLAAFNRLRAFHNLSFTYQEILHNVILGLDILRRKVLIVEAYDRMYDFKLIDLFEVGACNLKRIYRYASSGYFEKNTSQENLDGVALQFDFKSETPPVTLAFYRNMVNNVNEMAELECKAKQWEMLISKMLPFPQQEIA